MHDLNFSDSKVNICVSYIHIKAKSKLAQTAQDDPRICCSKIICYYYIISYDLESYIISLIKIICKSFMSNE